MEWDINRSLNNFFNYVDSQCDFHCNSVVRRSSDGNEGLIVVLSNNILDNRKLTNSTKKIMAACALIYVKCPCASDAHAKRFIQRDHRASWRLRV
jgi:hypothetical protein